MIDGARFVIKSVMITVLSVLVFQANPCRAGTQREAVRPFEVKSDDKAFNQIDTLVFKTLKEKGIEPAKKAIRVQVTMSMICSYQSTKLEAGKDGRLDNSFRQDQATKMPMLKKPINAGPG